MYLQKWLCKSIDILLLFDCLTMNSHRPLCILLQGCPIWYPNWVNLYPNGTNLGLFKISFSAFWLTNEVHFWFTRKLICSNPSKSRPIVYDRCTWLVTLRCVKLSFECLFNKLCCLWRKKQQLLIQLKNYSKIYSEYFLNTTYTLLSVFSGHYLYTYPEYFIFRYSKTTLL